MANEVSKSIRVLPAEVRMMVFTFTLINSAKDLFNLAISCKEMHQTFLNSQKIILPEFLSQLDPKELSIATAHYFATIAPWKYIKDLDVPVPQNREEYLQHVTAFCDEHLSKQGTELCVPKTSFTLEMLVACLEFQPDPTPVELAKVSKCLYIIDLVSILFPKSPVSALQHASDDISQHDHAFTKFWNCFAP
ncbi:hypothetical protein HD806DRAFT_543996 [Xylariaceae sp. AK1471]|nr:hypothetical protein HD806DRAFT_543996 [Xylariaceae sp. AK1471]